MSNLEASSLLLIALSPALILAALFLITWRTKSLRELFRTQPLKCSNCLETSPGLHQVWSGQRDGHPTEKICTKCLMARLATAIRGKNIVFVEPLTSDGYVYTPLAGTGSPSQSRMQLAVASMPPVCSRCTAQARHLWLPQEDLDYTSMEKQAAPNYYSIPHEPTKWASTIPLCDAHIISHLVEYLDSKKYYFLTFRFPDSGSAGYYD